MEAIGAATSELREYSTVESLWSTTNTEFDFSFGKSAGFAVAVMESASSVPPNAAAGNSRTRLNDRITFLSFGQVRQGKHMSITLRRDALLTLPSFQTKLNEQSFI